MRSLLVVLHKGADSRNLTGVYERGFPGVPPDVTFRYRILRVWEVPAQEWLAGGLGLVPLAPLGDVQPDQLPAVIAQVKQRLDREAPPSEAADLWSAIYILMGLRYEPALVQRLLQGVRSMKESSTYRAILEEGEAKGKVEGKAEEARNMLLMLGRDQFGEPPAAAKAALDSLTDVRRLEALALQVKHAGSWEQLLDFAEPRRRAPRKKS